MLLSFSNMKHCVEVTSSDFSNMEHCDEVIIHLNQVGKILAEVNLMKRTQCVSSVSTSVFFNCKQSSSQIHSPPIRFLRYWTTLGKEQE